MRDNYSSLKNNNIYPYSVPCYSILSQNCAIGKIVGEF